MACDITLGRLHPCKTVGGIKTLYFANFVSTLHDGLTLSADDEVTGFSPALALLQYDLRGAQSIDETNETNADSGTSFWSANGTITLKAQDLVTRKQMKLLALGRPHIIAEGYDGSFKLYGSQNGCDIAVNTNSGAGMGDFNGYTLTITSSESSPAYFVSSAIIGDTINSTVTAGV